VIIEPEQFDALQLELQQRLVERLRAHFSQTWPQQVKALGNRYQEFITSGVQKAQSYGLDTEQAIARYLNLWFVWGAEFEARPQHKWAREILTDAARPAHLKAHQLAWRTQQELKRRESARGGPGL
jgi:hypothetical protein